MTIRIASVVLVGAAVLVVVSGFVAIRSSAAANCPPTGTSVSHGAALFNGTNCPTCLYTCAGCHGNPSVPCDQSSSPEETCFLCPHPEERTKGTNLALYGARKDILRTFADGSMPMGPLTIEQTTQMFEDLGITTEDALNDLAAFLANADPRRYTIKGTIFHGLVGLDTGMPVALLDEVGICSDYNPQAATDSFGQSNSGINDLTYEVQNLPPGEYTVFPVSPSFPSFPPSRRVQISFLATSIEGCLAPDCTPPPVCSTDVTPVDFTLFDLGLGKLELLVASCRFCPLEVLSLLLKEIDQTIRQLSKDHKRAAVKSLQQFVRHTERFIRQGQLPEANGQSFIEQAEWIIERIDGQIARR